MNRKLLLFTVLFIFQNLINSAYNDCSAFTCSQLAVGNDQKCYLYNAQCKILYDDCTKISQNDCNNNVLTNEPRYKCSWNSESSQCEKKPRVCGDYSAVASLGVTCNSLEASANNKKCILVGGVCVEEEGCTGDSNSCSNHKPLLTSGDWDHLNKCDIDSEGSCSPTEKTCSDYIPNDDDEYCESFKASDPTKKKCFFIDGASKQCVDQYITCEAYNAETTKSQTGCEAVSPYINDKHSKCHYDEENTENICSTIKKACEDITDPITCVEHTLDNNKKRCVYKDSVTGCIEQFKTCALYNDNENNKSKDGCEAIEEDSTHKCVYTTTTNEGGTTTSICENKSKYQPCTSYTGKDIKECESIIPSENMRCIFKDDSQCVSVPLECNQYHGDDEYECVNNYKPLDENYKCVFRGGSCIKTLKFEYEYCYLGDANNCETIKPKSNGENYSIKCSYDEEEGKCKRVEKICSEGGSNAESCASIIPKNSKKKCILIGSTCTEEYKTCDEYNSDTSVQTIAQTTCESIISIDGKKCVYTAPTQTGGRGTCTGDNKPCSEFSSTIFPNACVSIPLNDITKKCVYESGDCKLETKSCSELVFNGNESGIEEKCKSAKVSDENNVCTSSSDKKYCIEVDKSKAPKDTTSTTKPNNGSQNSGTNTNSATGQEQGNDNNSGKEIYLDKLLIITLCLLF